MNFSDLQTEVFGRGYEYLNDGGTGLARVQRWINQAYKRISREEEWPWTYADASGAPPLTISDLRSVLSVTDSTNDNPLQRVDRRDLVEMYPDLPDTGTPEYFYRDSQTSIKVYPANTSISLSVRYCKAPADLTGTDTPLVPADYHDLIVDGAVLYAKKDDDTFDQLLQTFEQGLQQMRADYSYSDLSSPEQQTVYDQGPDSVGTRGW